MALKDLNAAARKWVKALKSGEYKQTSGILTKNGRFCCLGVACEIQDKVPKEDWKKDFILPEKVLKSLNLSTRNGAFKKGSFKAHPGATTLDELNDEYGVKFPEIADFIASNPTWLFKEKPAKKVKQPKQA